MVVAEIAWGRGKRSGATVGYLPRPGKTGRPGDPALAGILAASLALSLAIVGVPAWALDAGALPVGGKAVAGSAAISQTANVLTVQHRRPGEERATAW